MKSNDDLLDAIAKLARQDPSLDPRWRDLTQGAISDADRAALEALAERGGSAREAREVQRPLDEAVHDRINDSVLAQLAGGHEDSAPPSSQTRPLRARRPLPEVVEEPAPAAEEGDSLGGTSVPPELVAGEALWRDDQDQLPPARRSTTPPPLRLPWDAEAAASVPPAEELTHDRPATAPAPPAAPRAPERLAAAAGRRSRARTFATAAAWCAGALLLSFLALRPAAFAPGEPALTVYAVAPGAAAASGEEPALAREERVAPGERLEIVLRPEARVGTPLAVRAYLTRDGEVHPWKVQVRIDEDGGLHVAGTREQLFGERPDGAWDAVFAVGRADALPATAEALAATLREGGPAEDAGYRLIRRRVVLSER